MRIGDLENAVIGETILIGEYEDERIFMGFTPNKKLILTVTNDEFQTGASWHENEIEEWEIKQPEREIIQMYDTIDTMGNYCICNEGGDYPVFEKKRFSGSWYGSDVRKRNIIKPSIKIYKDSFEIVRE